MLQSRVCGQTLGIDATLVAFYDRVSHFRVANDFGEQQLTHPVYTGPDVRPMQLCMIHAPVASRFIAE